MKIFLQLMVLLLSFCSYSQTERIRDLAINRANKNLKMSELVAFANEKFENSENKAKFLYYWIGENVKYDYELWDNRSTLTEYYKQYEYNRYPTQVFFKKQAVCYGYAVLYQWFMKQLGIESEIVVGFIRDQRNHYIELQTDSEFSHAWNAIKIDGTWRLVDTTWGTSLDEKVADYFFDMPPWRAIITHYPEKSSWQLLEKPLTLEEFNKSVFVSPIWFKVGFSDIPKLKMDYKYYYLIFKNNPDASWRANLLYSVDNQNFYALREMSTIVQDGQTIFRFYKSIVPKKTYFKINIKQTFIGTDYSVKHNDIINFKM